MDLAPGTIIADKYRVERVLGKGGMGTVVIAMHLGLDQHVALKFLHDELVTQPALIERFVREAKASARLRSDHACRVLDVALLPSGVPMLVMELLEGVDLAKLCEQGPLDPATAADYVVQACVAVAEAHAAGIVHRDLKPSNLMLVHRVDGTPLIKVLDFGIAKLAELSATEFKITTTAAVMGSPGYMSPEQLRSAKDVDARSDVWSLGVILYELVSGRLPFVGTSITEIAVKVAMDPPEPLDAPPAYARVVFRAIEKDLALRYQTVAELCADLAPLGGPTAKPLAAVVAKLLAPKSTQRTALVADAGAIGLGSAPTTPSAPGAAAPDLRSAATAATAAPVAAAAGRDAAAAPVSPTGREGATTTLAGASGVHDTPIPYRTSRVLPIALGVVAAGTIAVAAVFVLRDPPTPPAQPSVVAPTPADAALPDAAVQLDAAVVVRRLPAPADAAPAEPPPEDLRARAHQAAVSQVSRQIAGGNCDAARRIAAIDGDKALIARAAACGGARSGGEATPDPPARPPPETIKAKFTRLDEAKARGDWRVVSRIAEEILDASPDNAMAHADAALAACNLGRAKDAARHLRLAQPARREKIRTICLGQGIDVSGAAE